MGCFWGPGGEGEDVEGGVDEDNDTLEVRVHGEGGVEADSADEVSGQYEVSVGLGSEVCEVRGRDWGRHHSGVI